MTVEQLEKRKELLLRKKELLEKRATLEDSMKQKEVVIEPSDVGSIFGKVKAKDYAEGKRNILGTVFERPGAAYREGIRALAPGGESPLEAFKRASVNPNNVETFQDEFLRKTPMASLLESISKGESPASKFNLARGIAQDFIASTPESISGGVADTLTNPGELLTIALGTAANIVKFGKAGTLSKIVGNTKLGKSIVKGLQKVGNVDVNPVNYAKKAITNLKKLGKAAKPNYIIDDIVPLAHDITSRRMNSFGTDMQSYAKSKNMPESAIKSITKHGVDEIKNTNLSYGDSTDPILQKIVKGFEQKQIIADDAYRAATRNAPSNTIFDLREFRDSIAAPLKKLQFIDSKGSITQRGATHAKYDTTYSKLLRLYDDLSTLERPYSRSFVSPKTGVSRLPEIKIRANKEQFMYYRDIVQGLYRDAPSDRNVAAIADKLYDLGEKQGMKGLQQARSLQKQHFQAKSKFMTRDGSLKSFKENKLDRFQKLSKDDVRTLKDIESYTGGQFVDDLDKVTAYKEFKKIEDFNIDKITRDLEKAKDPAWTNKIKNEYRPLLGGATDNIFKEVLLHRKAAKGSVAIKNAAVTAGGLIVGKELVYDPIMRLIGGNK